MSITQDAAPGVEEESASLHDAPLAHPAPAETFELAEWRLIIDPEPRSGAANMALDQALAEAAAAGTGPPTLRFYRWSPPAVSLGRHQPLEDIDLQTVEGRGYEVVRRPTGGRAILHTDEFTYSVAAAKDEPRVSGTLMEAYLRLSNALLSGLTRLGLAADKAGGDVRAGKDVSAACFEVPSAYEITGRDGRKLIGSAQSRRAGYVLQHGSLPLVGDIGRLIDVLAVQPAVSTRLRRQLYNRACNLAQALGVSEDDSLVQFDAVAEAMAEGFGATLNLRFKYTQPSPEELRRTAMLIRETFANPEWTNHR